MKLLVTGATGFVGRHLTKLLLYKGYDLHVIVRLKSDISAIDSRINIFKYDENIDSLIQYFQNEKFDGVIHLASLFLASHTQTDISGLINSNIKFGTELLEACKQSNVRWFINTGTFWQNFENSDYNPVNLYAATKEAFQSVSKYYTETSPLIFTTLKLNDTFGANDTRNKIFNFWSTIAKTGEILDMSMGEQLIDISYIEDVCSAYAVLIEHLNSENANDFNTKTFAVKSNEKISLKELAALFEEATSTTLKIKWGKKPYREREIMNPWDKGETVPYWKPSYSLKQAILKTIENTE